MPANAEGKPDHSKARAYLRTPFNEFLPRFAPQKNPKWIVYVSDESGSNEVYVQGFPEPRGKWQISNGGGSFPQWNPNGREIYYIGLDWMLKAVSVKIADTSITIGETRDLFRVPISPNPPYAVAPDGKRFLVRVPVQDQTAPLDVIINWPALLGKQGN